MMPVGSVHFRVLYLFAGKARQADFGQALEEVIAVWNADANANQILLTIEQIDTLRGGLEHNLLEPAAQDSYTGRITNAEFDLVIVPPPL